MSPGGGSRGSLVKGNTPPARPRSGGVIAPLAVARWWPRATWVTFWRPAIADLVVRARLRGPLVRAYWAF